MNESGKLLDVLAAELRLRNQSSKAIKSYRSCIGSSEITEEVEGRHCVFFLNVIRHAAAHFALNYLEEQILAADRSE